MKSLIRCVTDSNISPLTRNLEAVILEISKYGRPTIVQFRSGEWRAWTEVNNSAVQTTVEVKGGGDTARDACEQLLKNLKATVKSLGDCK